jgi:hypothetical protein
MGIMYNTCSKGGASSAEGNIQTVEIRHISVLTSRNNTDVRTMPKVSAGCMN